MKEKIVLPPKVKGNWWLDLSLFLGGLLATLSGIYFLVLPTGGYQGGRNPYYGIQVLFNRFHLGIASHLEWRRHDPGSSSSFCDPLELG